MIKCNFIRLFDIVFSLLAIFIFLPIFAICSTILLLTGEHKIIYRQKRVGRDGITFNLFKFATMLENSPNMTSGTITTDNDPRILPFGKVLRKTKFNELPQLFNIIKGDMSIVGPRPLTKETFDYYTPAQQRIIATVAPGLSGVGSLVFHDEESLIRFKSISDTKSKYKNEIAPVKAACEIWFIKHMSMALYFKIILATLLLVVMKKRNALALLDKNFDKFVKNEINYTK